MAGLDVLKKQIDDLNNKIDQINILDTSNFNQALTQLSSNTIPNDSGNKDIND